MAGSDINVTIPLLLHVKIDTLTTAMGGKEWLGYLKGLEAKPGQYFVTDVVVVKQTVTSASVHVDEPLAGNDVIGTVHSHHEMGAFFSQTDDDFIAVNHKVTVVYGKGEYKGQSKVTLPCGATTLREATVTVETPKPRDLDQFVEDAQNLISERVYVQPIVMTAVQAQGNHLYCGTCRKPIPPEKIIFSRGIAYCDDLCAQMGEDYQERYWND